MQINSNGHIPRSAAQWREIVARYRQSGLGRQEFCAVEGLTVRTLAKWAGRLRRSETQKGQFIGLQAGKRAKKQWRNGEMGENCPSNAQRFSLLPVPLVRHVV